MSIKRLIQVKLARLTKRESRARMLRRLKAEKSTGMIRTALIHGDAMGEDRMDHRLVGQLRFTKHGRYW